MIVARLLVELALLAVLASTPRAEEDADAMRRLGLRQEDSWIYKKHKQLGSNTNVWITLDGKRDFHLNLNVVHQDRWTAPTPTADDILHATPRSGAPGGLESACAGTLGGWCQAWFRSAPAPTSPAPRGSKPCPNGCNGVGSCNYDLGICLCPAGWTGDDCKTPFKRPCTNKFRERWDSPPMSHIDDKGEDLNLLARGSTPSRCAGWCDENVGACYCGLNSTYGTIPAPSGSPPGTEPIQYGRPMHEGCRPGVDLFGIALTWGVPHLHWDNLYGPTGWCRAPPEKIAHWCDCHSSLDGNRGCSQRLQQFCLNQCTDNGVCKNGFCLCESGWYGAACDKLKAGIPQTTRSIPQNLKPVIKELPAAVANGRKRPFIYVYDLPPDYNTRILQYARARSNEDCLWRGFDLSGNIKLHTKQAHLLETYIHEQLLISPHRTLDPEEADFFYMPIYSACFVQSVLGWADGPWYYEPKPTLRPMHIMNMMLEAKHWVQKHFPYWDRRQGKDHIFLMAHDEGACYAPKEIFENSIMLVHWGRTDLNHTSGTSRESDDYSTRKVVKMFGRSEPMDWVAFHEGHPCYTPGKDLVIPAMQALSSLADSPLLGMPPYKRDILLFFRGDVGLHRPWWYSRGIRQSLYRWSMEERWREKHSIVIGTTEQYPGPYSTMAARSKFCLVTMGDGWSARSEMAVLHGCIPVLINDNVEPVLHGVVDWEEFSIRVPQSRLHELPQILLAVNDTQLEHMQRALAQVWTRFMYGTGPVLRTALRNYYGGRPSSMKGGTTGPHVNHPYVPLQRFPTHRDAFSTIIQWLHSRKA